MIRDQRMNGAWRADDEPGTYKTIALAEKAVTEAGYVRDQSRHVWVHRESGKTAKVVRTDDKNNLQFSVQRVDVRF